MKKEGGSQTRLLNEASMLAFQNYIPLYTTIEIIHGCNFKCGHCYNYDRSDVKVKAYSENEVLSKEKTLKVIDDVCDEGAMFINLTGGEPLLSPHLLDYIKRIKNNNSMARLKTNASLLTRQRADELYESGLDQIDVSLYGVDEKVYKDFTGKEGFNRTIEGIKAAKASGIDVNVNIIIHKGNFRDLKEMISILEEIGVSFQYSDEITERYDESAGAKKFEISPDDFEELLLGEFGNTFWHNNQEKALQCSCARNVCAIALNGDVYPCIGAPRVAGSIKQQSFSKIWKSSPLFKEIRGIKESDFKSCISCDYIEFCSRSSGTSFTNSGDYYGCDEQSLYQAKIRKKNKEIFLGESK